MRYLAIVLIFFFSNHVQSDQLKLFTSDGCSLFPDGTYLENQLWLSCCVKHDLAYWMGGTRDRRKQADDELRQCVQDKDKTFLAKLMHNGVRVGGTPYLPTHFRWAYGWPIFRGYRVQNDDERQIIKQTLQQSKTEFMSRSDPIALEAIKVLDSFLSQQKF